MNASVTKRCASKSNQICGENQRSVTWIEELYPAVLFSLCKSLFPTNVWIKHCYSDPWYLVVAFPTSCAHQQDGYRCRQGKCCCRTGTPQLGWGLRSILYHAWRKFSSKWDVKATADIPRCVELVLESKKCVGAKSTRSRKRWPAENNQSDTSRTIE